MRTHTLIPDSLTPVEIGIYDDTSAAIAYQVLWDTALYNTHYFLTDRLGSVRMMTDASGVVKLEQDAPFGAVTSSTGTASTPFAFTGEIHDSTGLLYLERRCPVTELIKPHYVTRRPPDMGAHNPPAQAVLRWVGV